MTFKHKLSKRLAISRRRGVILLAAAGCTGDPSGSASVESQAVAVVIVPDRILLTPGQRFTFASLGVLPSGDSVPLPVTWSINRGRISADGEVAPDSVGPYLVTATHRQRLWLRAEAVAGVVAAGEAQLRVSPRAAAVSIGDSVTLSAYLVAGSDSTLTAVTWSADGGSVTKSALGKGRFKSDKPGGFKVRAAQDSLADTVTVTVGGGSVSSVTVAPTASTLARGGQLQLVVELRDSSGALLTGRAVTWTTGAANVATVSSSGLVAAQAPGSATVTATSEGKSGAAAVTVIELNASEPVYSATNPDHVLHVYEDWSGHTSISSLGSARRGDGGPPWTNVGIRQYGAVVNAPDPFGSVRYVTTDYATDPPIPPHGTGAHAAGFHWYGAGGTDAQGDDNAVGGGKNNRGFALSAATYLNKPAKAAVVYEWAVRYRGSNWYEGKTIDINAGLSNGVGRFNFEPFDATLGWTANCSDPVCAAHYMNAGATPRYSGLPPTSTYTAPNITRSQSVGDLQAAAGTSIIWYKQNRAWSLATGQFSWGGGAVWPSASANADLRGTNTPMWQAGWLYYKLRITKQAPGQGFGNGRIEMWVGSTPGTLVKVMEYLGDPGQRDGGNVYVDPTGNNDQLAGDLHFFGLASRRYTGGGQVDIGTIRIWSHSRQ